MTESPNIPAWAVVIAAAALTAAAFLWVPESELAEPEIRRDEATGTTCYHFRHALNCVRDP